MRCDNFQALMVPRNHNFHHFLRRTGNKKFQGWFHQFHHRISAQWQPVNAPHRPRRQSVPRSQPETNEFLWKPEFPPLVQSFYLHYNDHISSRRCDQCRRCNNCGRMLVQRWEQYWWWSCQAYSSFTEYVRKYKQHWPAHHERDDKLPLTSLWLLQRCPRCRWLTTY